MDVEEKIRQLEEEIRNTEKNKATEKHLRMLKKTLARLRREKKRRIFKSGFKPSGDALVVVVGYPTPTFEELFSGKENRMLEHEHVKIHLTKEPFPFQDIPKLRMADALILTPPEMTQTIEQALAHHGIFPVQQKPVFSIAPAENLEIIDKTGENDVEALRRVIRRRVRLILESKVEPRWFAGPEPRFPYLLTGPEDLKTLRRRLNLLRIWTAKRGEVAGKPLIIRGPATIRDVVIKIHKDLLKRFRFAKIKRNGRLIRAGLNYPVQDGDVVEVLA